MTSEIQYGETVIGLPDHTQLPLDFWEDVLAETISWQPIVDDELGIVWQSGHIQDYSDLVRLLSASQILTGLREEIYRNLEVCKREIEKSGYLRGLTQKLKVDHLRETHENKHRLTIDFSDNDLEKVASTAHRQLLNEIQIMLNNAYNFIKTGNSKFNPFSNGSDQKEKQISSAEVSNLSQLFDSEHDYLSARQLLCQVEPVVLNEAGVFHLGSRQRKQAVRAWYFALIQRGRIKITPPNREELARLLNSGFPGLNMSGRTAEEKNVGVYDQYFREFLIKIK